MSKGGKMRGKIPRIFLLEKAGFSYSELELNGTGPNCNLRAPSSRALGRGYEMIKEEAVFKGTRDGLLIILDDHCEFKQVVAKLRSKLEAARGFFEGAHVIIDPGTRELTNRQRKTLSRLVNSQAGLTLKGFNNEKLAEIDDEESGASEVKGAELHDQAVSTSVSGTVSDLPVMFIDRNLRCGQQVNFAGHVVITGDVNPGAEVIADGNVLVTGALRGLVHAGASGDQQAFVVAYRLEPSQLRIAGVFTRSPDDEARQFAGRPEIARLRNGTVIVEQNAVNQTLSLVQRG